MGSSNSTNSDQHERERARLEAHKAEINRQRAVLAAERLKWEEQQKCEQHWREQQFREEQKRRESELEWQRQADIRQLRLEQQKIQKELEEQKTLRLLEQEKLQKQLEEQKRKQETLEEQRLILQQIQLHQQQAQQCTTVAAATNPFTSYAVREAATVQQRASPTVHRQAEIPAEPKEKPKSYLARINESNVKLVEWSIIDYIQDENCISQEVTLNVMKLLDDNNTIPFIARYRRHLTQGMDAEKLRKIRNSYEEAKLIKQRAVAIVKDIEEKDQWTPEFHAFVHETKSLDDLEYIHSIFKVLKSKTVKTATKLGLGIAAEACMKNKTPPIAQLVQKTVEGLKTEEQVKNGIICLIADSIIRDRRTFDKIKKLRSEHPMKIETTKGKDADKLKNADNKYESYYNFMSFEHDLKPDQVFMINRGEALKALSVKIIISEEIEREFKKQCAQQLGFTDNVVSIKRTLIDSAIELLYNKLVKSSIAKRVRKEINDKAQNTALDGLTQNVKQHLLAPPARGKVVIGINPGFQRGCKFAVISKEGDVLETGTIYPNNTNNPKDKSDAERVLRKMVCKHKCTVFALGNGIASRETEIFLIHVLKNKQIPGDVFYTIVDASGASIYSCSRDAALEFPNVEADTISAVSIARRLQDPMAELVKIEPELLTTNIYQHDLPQKQMAMKINEIIVEVVSYVGVDANTASMALLKRIAGLDDIKARSIIDWRLCSGPFTNRKDLLKVRGINKRTYEQCAGFIRIVPETAEAIGGQVIQHDSFNYLDQTWIHPESYSVAKSFVEAAKCNALQLGTNSFIFALNLYAQVGVADLAKRFGTNTETIKIILQGLTIEKGQDIRGKEDNNMFRKSLIRFHDLNNGDILTGVVTHLTNFGAFVDVGAEIDGMIHKNFMNGLTVEVDQKVEVRVSRIRKEVGRLGLTLIKCI